MANDADATELTLLLEVFAIFYFENLLNSTDAEFAAKLEMFLIKQTFKVQLVLFQIIEERLIALFISKHILNRSFKNVLHYFVLVSRS